MKSAVSLTQYLEDRVNAKETSKDLIKLTKNIESLSWNIAKSLGRTLISQLNSDQLVKSAMEKYNVSLEKFNEIWSEISAIAKEVDELKNAIERWLGIAVTKHVNRWIKENLETMMKKLKSLNITSSIEEIEEVWINVFIDKEKIQSESGYYLKSQKEEKELLKETINKFNESLGVDTLTDMADANFDKVLEIRPNLSLAVINEKGALIDSNRKLLTPFVYNIGEHHRETEFLKQWIAFIETKYSEYEEQAEREVINRMNHRSKKFKIDLSDSPNIWKIIEHVEATPSGKVTSQKKKEVTRKLIVWEINKKSSIWDLWLTKSTLKRLVKYFPEIEYKDIKNLQVDKLFPIRKTLNEELPPVGMSSINIALNLIEENES